MEKLTQLSLISYVERDFAPAKYKKNNIFTKKLATFKKKVAFFI